MEFKYESRDVQTAGAISTKAIGMKTGAKAFRILFGTMYPDIIKALVREIFTNAWDSQKNAGNLHLPIDIHSPTAYEPYFSVRDYGTGMSPATVDDIYSNVFASSKDTSNEEAGFMGMGSKTPLGYSDSFTLISYYNGEMSLYNIYLDKDGAPVITLNLREKTDEMDGVLVQVPVEAKDFDMFIQHIKKFCFGSMQSINVNGKKFEDTLKVFDQGTGWALINGPISGAHVRMGPVLYAINSNTFANYLKTNAEYELRNFLGSNFVLDFNIGDFDVTGSREDIIYNKDSVGKIVARLLVIREEIEKRIEAEFASCRTWFDAMTAYYKFRSESVYKSYVKNVKWRGMRLETDVAKRPEYFKGVTIFHMSYDRIKTMEYSNVQKVPSAYYDGKIRFWTILHYESGLRNFRKKIMHYKSQVGRNADILIVRVDKPKVGEPDETRNGLRRIAAFTRGKLVNLADIELPKAEKQEKKKKDYVVYTINPDKIPFYRNYRSYGAFDANMHSKYYISCDRNTPVGNLDKINAAAKFFNVGTRRIPMLNKTQAYIATENNLIDIEVAYDAAMMNVKLNEHEIVAIARKTEFKYNLKVMNEIFREIYPEVFYDPKKVRKKIVTGIDFHKETIINESVKTKMQEIAEKIKDLDNKFHIRFLDVKAAELDPIGFKEFMKINKMEK